MLLTFTAIKNNPFIQKYWRFCMFSFMLFKAISILHFNWKLAYFSLILFRKTSLPFVLFSRAYRKSTWFHFSALSSKLSIFVLQERLSILAYVLSLNLFSKVYIWRTLFWVHLANTCGCSKVKSRMLPSVAICLTLLMNAVKVRAFDCS